MPLKNKKMLFIKLLLKSCHYKEKNTSIEKKKMLQVLFILFPGFPDEICSV